MKILNAFVFLGLTTSVALAANDPHEKTAEKPAAAATKPAPSPVASAPAARVVKPAPVVVPKRVYVSPRAAPKVAAKKKSTKATGKVRVLSANSLPVGAIVPPLQAAPAMTKPETKPANSQTPVYVLTDPNLRWQLYSYP
ncbi:hypothetical protein SAMN05660284_02718 [Formivibrio citricus]|uniref:Uncharacterized protein n=1 Tax=Formivibrio citricus TaxID=83765 RepID=A0A1I5DQ30_9NEIS|nr:hypothetical protein [Formivibrio citricus]SFO01257.1 hypothetical protein SAMN05660284_02718 [Formivibrio citricus]